MSDMSYSIDLNEMMEDLQLSEFRRTLFESFNTGNTHYVAFASSLAIILIQYQRASGKNETALL